MEVGSLSLHANVYQVVHIHKLPYDAPILASPAAEAVMRNQMTKSGRGTIREEHPSQSVPFDDTSAT